MASDPDTRTAAARVRPEVERYGNEAIQLRRYAHMHPEISWEEHETQKWILGLLADWGLCDIRPLAGTGATGLVTGQAPGPTVLWRADIDALPLREQTGLPFASKNDGKMHACGHDNHIGVALALSHFFAEQPPERGNVRFVFQPAEEVGGGAAVMIDEGILTGPDVDYCLGFHADTSMPVGELSAREGPFMPIPAAFELVIHGRGGHAGLPHRSVDAVVVSAHVITALQAIVSRNLNPENAGVVSISIIEGGNRGNILPDDVRMAGSLRAFDQETLLFIERRFRETVDGVTRAFGATYGLNLSTGLGGVSVPAVVNNPLVTDVVRAAASEVLGEARIRRDRTTMSDDMALFLRQRPGCYFLLGVGRGPAAEPNHSPRFDPDDRALPAAVDLAVRSIERLLAIPS